MKYFIFICLLLLSACSKPQGSNPITPPDNPPKDTTTQPPKDTTTQPPKDTTVHHDTIITKVVGMTDITFITKKDMSQAAAVFTNSSGKAVDLETSAGHSVQLSFVSSDTAPTILKQSKTDFIIACHDVFHGLASAVTSHDTTANAHWIITGIDKKKYGCNRLVIVVADGNRSTNNAITLRVAELKDDEAAMITRPFFLQALSHNFYGIVTLQY